MPPRRPGQFTFAALTAARIAVEMAAGYLGPFGRGMAGDFGGWFDSRREFPYAGVRVWPPNSIIGPVIEMWE